MFEHLYVVLIQPTNGGHGAWPAVVQITLDPTRAVATARTVESLGFRINWHNDDVRIDRILAERVYSREDYKSNSHTVYTRRSHVRHVREEAKIEEFFWNSALAHKFGVTRSNPDAIMLEPSVPLST